jgi:hypothetical protein
VVNTSVPWPDPGEPAAVLTSFTPIAMSSF